MTIKSIVFSICIPEKSYILTKVYFYVIIYTKKAERCIALREKFENLVGYIYWICRIILNIAMGVTSIMLLASLIYATKTSFFILLGIALCTVGTVYMLADAVETIKNEATKVSRQIKENIAPDYDKTGVIRSYILIFCLVWLVPYLPGILMGIPQFGFIVWIPAMVLFFVVAMMMEKYLDYFLFDRKKYRMIHLFVHVFMTALSCVAYFFRLK